MNPIHGPAPADAKPHRRWPVWQVILVYLLFFAVASLSVVQIDRDVMRAVATFESPDVGPGVHATALPSK